ncbi:glycosyltransferase [Anaerofustis sp. HA2171]|uniref:glycosyltransferase n=1 Tax=Anaerofustis butyriciformans TaxID=3108533 RepID=UPI002E3259E0|nr:glycosyltransferase [Anaerofustis sp. HA2171]
MDEKLLDRISQAYKGELGESSMDDARKRIDWMCSKVKGESVLDVGCSQGITSILLAKQGKNVTGIDPQPSRIDYANKEKENEKLSDNLTFICDDFLAHDFESKFDCIVMGEILEHLFNPILFLDKAKDLLSEKGRLIVTVPFGINPFPDHKRTYYFTELFKQINERVCIVDVVFFGSWIGFIAEADKKECDIEIDTNLVEKIENAFFIVDEKNHQHINMLKDKINYFQNKIEDMKVDLLDCKGKNKDLNSANALLSKEKDILENKFKDMNDLAYSQKVEIKTLKIRINELEQGYIGCKNAYDGLLQLKGIKIWRKLRALLRKPYNPYVSNVRISNKNLNSLNNTANKKKVISSFEKKQKYEQESINKDFFNSIEDLTSNIKESNGSSYYNKSNMKVGIITDEFMFNYYKDALDLVYISPDNYEQVIENENLDFVLFVSCWHGMYGREDYYGADKRNNVCKIMQFAKQKGVKTVFQTIEDPTNYDFFIKIAKETDYIFTSDMNMIEKYKEDTKNENVFYLGYGINPQFHNPISTFNKRKENKFKNSVFFAGSWAERYPDRCQNMQMLFDGVIKNENSNLIIADRNMNIDGYAYPEKYSKYIIPPIKHDILQKVHKLFDYTLNLNTITNSPTMCAMRVYEVQAMGSLLISNYSLASSNTFPAIFNITDSNEVPEILKGYSTEQIISMELEGIRNVFSEYTVFDRLNYIFEKINIDYKYEEKTVYVLYDKLTENIQKSFDQQKYNNKQLISIEDACNKNISTGYFIVFNDKEYNENYILDLINATKYTNTEYVKYCDYTDYDRAFEYCSDDNSKEETMYDCSKVNINEILKFDKKLQSGFSIPYHSLHEDNTDTEKELSVIIPVYNNGVYLRNRAFRSLRRSSIFNKMQVYLVDDGSDKETIDQIKQLEKEYSNVTTYFFNDGGSGSASRPRNKGFEIAKEPYVTYLDPDNEAINDGYTKLLEKLKSEDVDFAFGSISKIDDSVKELAFRYEDMKIKNPRKELINNKFKTNSIQACVIKRELIENNKIESPVGAIGQDTMFFYELMLNAKSVYHMYIPIHIYYAQRAASVVNTINKSFFEKSLIMETYQVEALKKYDILDKYKQIKYNQFFKGWYLEKLKHVREDQKEYCEEILNKIALLYGL